MAEQTITKQDAALRQLREAIQLFFSRRDMIAVHTLTAASFQLLHDIGKREGIVSRYRSEEVFAPGRREEFMRALNRTQNFLKHAERDADEVLAYNEEVTVLYLFETVELAYAVLKAGEKALLAFRLWFVFSYPDLVKPELFEKLSAVNQAGIDQTDRDLWLRYLTEP